MGHSDSRNTMAVVVSVVVVAAVAGAVVYKTVFSGPGSPASAVASVGATVAGAVAADGGAGESAADEARLSSLLTMLQTVMSQTALWRLQHQDNLPDFRKYPNWEQLTEPTYVDGTPVSAATSRTRQQTYGPYLQVRMVNPLNNLSSVAVVEQDPQPGDAVKAAPGGPGKVGFVFSEQSGRWWGTDAAGTRIADPQAAARRAQERAQARAFANATPAARMDMFQSTLQIARSQIELYKLQHGDRLPDFRSHQWEQLLKTTDQDGKFTRGARYGPYMHAAPKNPFNGFSNVEVTNDPAAGPGYRAKGSQVGWVLDQNAGKLWGTDANGVVIAQ